MQPTPFNLQTCQAITDQLRVLLTGKEYSFDNGRDDRRTERLAPEDSTDGDAFGLSRYEDWVLLTVCDTYGVWQISDGDVISIGQSGEILVEKTTLPDRRTWTITPLN